MEATTHWLTQSNNNLRDRTTCVLKGFRVIKSSASLLSILLFANLSLPLHAQATDPAPEIERWNFTSFGTVGIAHTQGQDLTARRDIAQPDTFNNDWSWKLDSLVGAQVNAQLSDTISLAVQGVLKSRAEQSLDRSIERAFLGWQVTPRLSLQAGRIGVDFYMLSDYRDIGFAYLWARPPAEFYGTLFQSNIDGAGVVYKYPLASGSVVARLYGGTHQGEVDVETTTGAHDADPIRASGVGGSIAFESEKWRLKIGGGRVRFDRGLHSAQPLFENLNNPTVQALWPAAAKYAEIAEFKGSEFGFYSAGASYDDSIWQVSGEVGYLDSGWDLEPNMLSAYLSLGRHIGQVTPYLILADAHSDSYRNNLPPPATTSIPQIDVPLQMLRTYTENVFHLVGADQHTVSLGARWDLLATVAFKVQWDHTRVAAESAALWWNNTNIRPAPAATVDLVSASVNWVY